MIWLRPDALSEPNRRYLDVAIYHCQQAAEKALKGYLAFWDQQPAKTHDLGLLLEKAAEIEAGFGSWQDAADRSDALRDILPISPRHR